MSNFCYLRQRFDVDGTKIKTSLTLADLSYSPKSKSHPSARRTPTFHLIFWYGITLKFSGIDEPLLLVLNFGTKKVRRLQGGYGTFRIARVFAERVPVAAAAVVGVVREGRGGVQRGRRRRVGERRQREAVPEAGRVPVQRLQRRAVERVHVVLPGIIASFSSHWF